jgi:phosphoesterase RecJ-like protein
MTLGLRELGKDVVMHLAGEAPLPGEFGFLPLDELPPRPPRRPGRTRPARRRLRERAPHRPSRDALDGARLVVDVDHHHDNNRFGDVNLIVADASSTAEIVRDVLAGLGVPLTPEIAEALYVGLVTDTGRFQYANTSPKALRLAAELVEAGADVHGIFRNVYETVQIAKLKLLGRALEHAQVYEGGRLVVSHLLAQRLRRGRRGRAVLRRDHRLPAPGEGAELVALIREPPTDGGPMHRISLRSSRTRSTSRRSHGCRAAAATGRPPGSRASSRSRRSSSSSGARSSPQRAARGRMPPRAARPVGVVLVDKPRGGRRSRSSRSCAADRRPHGAHRHARSVRHLAFWSVVRIGN